MADLLEVFALLMSEPVLFSVAKETSMDGNRSRCEYPKWKEEKPQKGSCEPFVQFNYPIKRRKEKYFLLVNHIDKTTAAQTSPDTATTTTGETTTTGAGESGPLSTTTLGGHPGAGATVTPNTTTSDGMTGTCKKCKILLFHASRNPRSVSLPQIYRTIDHTLSYRTRRSRSTYILNTKSYVSKENGHSNLFYFYCSYNVYIANFTTREILQILLFYYTILYYSTLHYIQGVFFISQMLFLNNFAYLKPYQVPLGRMKIETMHD